MRMFQEAETRNLKPGLEGVVSGPCGYKQRLYVSTLMTRVLTRCGAITGLDSLQEPQVATFKHLVTQTMEGVTITKDFPLNAKKAKKACKKVVDELQKAHSPEQLESMFQTRSEVLESVLIESMQDRIKGLIEKFKAKASKCIHNVLFASFIFTLIFCIAFLLVLVAL